MDYDNKKLKALYKLLKKNREDYISMIGVGSTITGDPYIEGRTNKDVLLTFNKDYREEASLIEAIVKKFKFEQNYTFTPILKEDFGRADSKYSFSDKFRSKTLYGEDLVNQAKLPDKEKGREMYSNGFKDLKDKLNNIILNSSNWPSEKVRNKSWEQLKHVFMYLAIKEYYLSGEYPRTRNEVVNKLDSRSIEEAFMVLHSIDMQPKRRIIKCARDVINYLNKVEREDKY